MQPGAACNGTFTSAPVMIGSKVGAVGSKSQSRASRPFMVKNTSTMPVRMQLFLLLAVVAASAGTAESDEDMVIGRNPDGPAWPQAAGMAPLDPAIKAATPRVLKLGHAQSLYEDSIDWSDDPATQKSRLEAAGRIEALIDRYLECDAADERTKIIAALNAIGAPPQVYEQILLRGGVKQEFPPNALTLTLNIPVKDFKPLPDDPDKTAPLTVTVSVVLPADYSPFKRYGVNFGGSVNDDKDFIHVSGIVTENANSKAAPIYMTWRGRSQFNALFNALLREISIDPDRVIASGFSVGGIAALRWGLYCPDRFAAINAQSSPPLSELDLPMIANYSGIPLFWYNDPGHTGTPPEIAAAFAGAVKKAGLDACIVNAGDEARSNDKVPAFLARQIAARRELCANRVAFACNDLQVSRRGWIRIDAFDARNNPEFELRLHKPNGAELGGVIETKKLRANPGAVTAAIDGNTIDIKTQFVTALTIYLARGMVDFSKPVAIAVNGRQVQSKLLTPALEFMLDEARQTGRRDRLYVVSCAVRVPN